LKVLFNAPYDFLRLELEKLYPSLKFIYKDIWTREEFENQNLSGVDILIPNPGWNFILDTDVLKNFENLPSKLVISTPSTGLNHLSMDLEYEAVGLRKDPIELAKITASGEYTVLLALVTVRKFLYAISEIKEGRWRHNEELMRGSELSALNVGIVGFGRNGNLLARVLNAMGNKTIKYFDPYVKSHNDNLNIEKVNKLDDLDCELMVITCALERETRNLINRKILDRLSGKLKYIVNTSRGEIVHEHDMVSWLKVDKSRLFSADTLCGEVVGRQFESPLLDASIYDQVIVTPHVAGASNDSQTKAAIQAVKQGVEIFKAQL